MGDPIGKGGWGTIYRTRKEGGQTHYALKEIPFEDGDGDDSETHKEVSMLKQVGALCVLAFLGDAGVTHRHALEHCLVDAVSFAVEDRASTRTLHKAMLRIASLTLPLCVAFNQAEHPNIVRYVDSFTGPSTGSGRGQSLYIVMELVEGSTLMELINSHIEKNQRIPEKRVRQLLVPLCHALYYIHKKKKITHRDMKPQNILINTEIDVLTGETVDTPPFPFPLHFPHPSIILHLISVGTIHSRTILSVTETSQTLNLKP